METRSVYIAYAPVDKPFLDKLSIHLNAMERQGLINAWTDEEILAGENYMQATEKQIANAQIIMLLVSADFLASDFCVDRLLNPIMQKHEAGEALVIPIIARYCDWYTMPFAKVKALPLQDGKVVPIKDWNDPDKAYYSISQELRKIIQPNLNVQPTVTIYNDTNTNEPKTGKNNFNKIYLFVGFAAILVVALLLLGQNYLRQDKTTNNQLIPSKDSTLTSPVNAADKEQIQQSTVDIDTNKAAQINNQAPKTTAKSTKPIESSPKTTANPSNKTANAKPQENTTIPTPTPQTQPITEPAKVTIRIKIPKPLDRKAVYIDDKPFSFTPYPTKGYLEVSNVPIGMRKIMIDKANCSTSQEIKTDNQVVSLSSCL